MLSRFIVAAPVVVAVVGFVRYDRDGCCICGTEAQDLSPCHEVRTQLQSPTAPIFSLPLPAPTSTSGYSARGQLDMWAMRFGNSLDFERGANSARTTLPMLCKRELGC